MLEKRRKERIKRKVNEILSADYIATLPLSKMKGSNVEISLEYYINRFIRNASLFYEFNSDYVKETIEKTAKWFEGMTPNDKVERLYDDSDSIAKEEITQCFEAFVASLSTVEYFLLKPASYPSIIDLSERQGTHMHVDKDGTIIEASEIYPFVDTKTDFLYSIVDKNIDEIKTMFEQFNNNRKVPKGGEEVIAYLTGKNIEDVVEYLQKNKLIKMDNKVYSSIENYHLNKAFQEELLNCVMYKIINDDIKGYGPRRALIFAKCFNLNKDIPVIYGLDYTQKHTHSLLSAYLLMGGDEKLIGYSNYGSDEPISFAILEEVLDEDFGQQTLVFDKKEE